MQDGEQGLEEEIEEVVRLGKYREEGVRPIKIRMRSQAAAERILSRTGRLASRSEYERVWIKRDMNSEERKMEGDLREEAKEKKPEQDRERREGVLLESDGHEAEEVVYSGERSNGRETVALSKKRGSGKGKLRVMYTNIDGLGFSILEVKDYLRDRKPDVLCLTETKLKKRNTPVF